MEEGAIKGRDISERGYICPLSMLPYSPLYVFIDFILIFFSFGVCSSVKKMKI